MLGKAPIWARQALSQASKLQVPNWTEFSSKSRLNFLELLRSGHTDYVINDAALEYMREHDLSGTVIRQLEAHAQRQFCRPGRLAAPP